MAYRNTQKGISLIETLITIGIVSVFVLSAITFLLFIMGSESKTSAHAALHLQAYHMLDMLHAQMLDADEITDPVVGDNDTSLDITTSVSNVTFYKAGNNLFFSDGVGGQQKLNQENVQIEDLTFTNLSFTDTPVVRVELTLAITYDTERLEQTFVSSFTP